MTTIAERLGAYGANLRYEDLPDEVRHQAKRVIVDTVGCAIGAYASEPSKIARALAAVVQSREPATVIGSGVRTSIDLATFANGVMIRYLDFNDGYTGLNSGHPSDSIAAVLSCAEACHRDGREMIAATIAAYETFCRVCDMRNLKPLGFDHSTIGCMASTVAAARLMGLNEAQSTEAVNLAVAANIALFQTRIGKLSMWKACAFANASRNAVFAAQLARLGMTGRLPCSKGREATFMR